MTIFKKILLRQMCNKCVLKQHISGCGKFKIIYYIRWCTISSPMTIQKTGTVVKLDHLINAVIN